MNANYFYSLKEKVWAWAEL